MRFASLKKDHGAGFAERLREAVDSYGSANSLAIASGGRFSQGALSKWVRGETEPTVSAVNFIADATGFNVEWLVGGVGPKRKNEAAEQPGSYLAPGVRPLDAELLRATIVAVEEHLKEHLPGTEVLSDKKADLFLAAYEAAEAEGKVNGAKILRLIRLMK